MVDLDAQEKAFKIVFKKRRFLRIEPAEGTTPADITDLTLEEEQEFARSNYGLRPLITLYETNTQGPNTCYIIIGRKKVEVPCG
jgi:hypothetical protein